MSANLFPLLLESPPSHLSSEDAGINRPQIEDRWRGTTAGDILKIKYLTDYTVDDFLYMNESSLMYFMPSLMKYICKNKANVEYSALLSLLLLLNKIQDSHSKSVLYKLSKLWAIYLVKALELNQFLDVFHYPEERLELLNAFKKRTK